MHYFSVRVYVTEHFLSYWADFGEYVYTCMGFFTTTTLKCCWSRARRGPAINWLELVCCFPTWVPIHLNGFLRLASSFFIKNYFIGHTRTISIPDCLEFKITTNACRGFCESWSLPSIMLGFKRHPVTSLGQCCNIMDAEDVSFHLYQLLNVVLDLINRYKISWATPCADIANMEIGTTWYKTSILKSGSNTAKVLITISIFSISN